jgi:rhamnulokinase
VECHRFLAFDLGAESGRAVVGELKGRRLSLEEIHRFSNEPVELNKTLYWDALSIYNNLLRGMREYTRQFGDSPDGIGIDTWGVDFGLLSSNGELIQNPVHYRDRRTEGMLQEVCSRIAPEELFNRTGMSLLSINTSVQLLALRLNQNSVLDSANNLLMMPDLFAYFLTGQRGGERTNAVSTQLYDPWKNQWSDEVFTKLNLPRMIMPDLIDSGTKVGELRQSVKNNVGLKRGLVIAPCSHDTASAVAAVPARGEDWAFLSCGTWSVLGALSDRVVTSPEAYAAGVFNELTFKGRFLCRNIIGLWLLQQARACWEQNDQTYSNEELVKQAAGSPGGPIINPDDERFLAPRDMVYSIQEYCLETGQRSPEGPGETTRCILESLALAYRHRLDQLAGILGRRLKILHIVGGGSNNSLLCQLTANAVGLPILAGPAEATVIGNMLVQDSALGGAASPEEIREIVRFSTSLTEYEPRDTPRWQDLYEKYLQLRKSYPGRTN